MSSNRKITKKNLCQTNKQFKNFLKHTSKPNHITYKIFGKNYAAILEIKSVLTLNKPLYVRFTVLELSK